tara:strand:- start:1263 stop:1595 length:333 start_codon:yes stop_codon:yes gene_type:complete
MALKKSSQLRQQEHVSSTQFHTAFDGTLDTCPYRVGDLYDERPIISIGFTETVYGKYYHIIVERGRAHTRMKFEFDSKHDLKFSKPTERMGTQATEDIQKYLKLADTNKV